MGWKLAPAVQVGGREDSNVYIRMKLKAAEEIGDMQTIAHWV